MYKRVLYVLLLVICCSCGALTTAEEINNVEHISDITMTTDTCQPINLTHVFTDTTWFLSYIDADLRDTTRSVFEQWIFHIPTDEAIDKNCYITLTLYQDSTYIYSSPCEWDFPSAGYYTYVCDTLYCVEIDINDHSISSYNPPRVQWLEKLIRKNNKLHYIWRKGNSTIGNDAYITNLSLVLEKVK